MLRRSVQVLTPAVLLSACAFVHAESNPRLAEISQALGADGLTSLQFTASGHDYAFGQAPNVKAPWPKFNVKSYQRVVTFEPWATRLERVRTQFENPPRGGGGQPIVGEQTQTQSVATGSANAALHRSSFHSSRRRHS